MAHLIREYDINENTYFAIEGKSGRLAVIKKVPIENGIVKSSCDGIYEGIRYLHPDKKNRECYYRSYHRPEQYDDTYTVLCPTLLGSYNKGKDDLMNEDQMIKVALDSAGMYLLNHKTDIRKYQELVLREYRTKLTARSRDYNYDKYWKDQRDYQNIMFNLDFLVKVAHEYEETKKSDLVFSNMIVKEKFASKSAVLPLEKVSN